MNSKWLRIILHHGFGFDNQRLPTMLQPQWFPDRAVRYPAPSGSITTVCQKNKIPSARRLNLLARMTRKYTIYASYRDKLTGIERSDSNEGIDGSYGMAKYYGPAIDDGILHAVRELYKIHATGNRIVIQDDSTSLDFLLRLRNVNSLHDYIILALKCIALEKNWRIEPHEAQIDCLEWERSGYLKGEVDFIERRSFAQEPQFKARLVHISDLMNASRLSLKIPARDYQIEREEAEDTSLLLQSSQKVPRYCFVSHAWVDEGMPDTEDAKFFRAFLLSALAVYIDTGIEYFWLDYLSVTQDPNNQDAKRASIERIPEIARSSSYQINFSLEIYQYHTSAWCAYETLCFLAENPTADPLDFVKNGNTKTVRYQMNLVDSTKANANHDIICGFGDARLACGSPQDVEYLNTFIARSRNLARIRLWRLACRKVKSMIGMARDFELGFLVTEPIAQYLKQNNLLTDQTPVESLFKEINANLTAISHSNIPEDSKNEIAETIDAVKRLLFGVNTFGFFMPDDKMVRPRGGDVYTSDHSGLRTSYAYHNQMKGIVG